MRYYIDCEFDGHNGPLLSMAIIPEHPNGVSVHITVNDAPPPSDPWVAENVMSVMSHHDADLLWELPTNDVGDAIRHVLEHDTAPVIIADSPVDIGRFCEALSTGPDGGWQSSEYPRITFEVHNVDCYPTKLVGAVQHNAWWDAMALREKLSA